MASDSSESNPQSIALTLGPYVFHKLRIDKSQTRLLVEHHQLVCTPYRLSSRDAVLFAVLSPDETKFFAQHVGAACVLRIAFATSGSSVSPQLHSEGVLTRVGAVQGRENVTLFAMRFTKVPESLPKLLSNFNRLLQHLQSRFAELREQRIPMESLRIQQALGYRKYAELRVRSKTYAAIPRVLGTDRAELRLNTAHIDFAAHDTGTLRLDFNGGIAKISCTVSELVSQYSQATAHVAVELHFDPLYVEILDRFFAIIEKAKEREPAPQEEEAAEELTEEA